MSKIRRVGSGGTGSGIQVGDKVVHKDDPDTIGVVEGFQDGEVEVRWDNGPAISWEDGGDLVRWYESYMREYDE